MDQENHEKQNFPNVACRNVRDRIRSQLKSETEIRLRDLHTPFRVAVSNWRAILAFRETFLHKFSRPTKGDGGNFYVLAPSLRFVKVMFAVFAQNRKNWVQTGSLIYRKITG